MEKRTQAIIAATLVALGIGVLALGLLEDESDVRYVHDILANPDKHQDGSYTLLGVPQPPTVPATAAGGATIMEPNPQWRNETRHVAAVWTHNGTPVQSVHITTVTVDAQTGISHWTFRNETRSPGQSELIDSQESSWTLTQPHKVFLIQGFPDGTGTQPLLWGILEGGLKDPMQITPSQFKGRLMTTLPDGNPLPPGALLYNTQEYTAGCSSKFLPPEAKEQYEANHTA